MFIQQTDLFRGMSKDFVKKVYDTAVKESFTDGELIFPEGEKAKYFYILLKGRVKLEIGEFRQLVYTVEHPGEAFGWSSLVGRENYSASAKCMADTKLVKFDGDTLCTLLEKDPSNGLQLFRRLSGALGERLINIYGAFAFAQPSEDHRTYGSSLTLKQTGGEVSESSQ
ncbi:MAG: cyclic nucleotide-binding domain-containing protein [Deltaproteobacteria bacterium]|nr:cyclic nucleotide-binding domain-containing protein [Deltaproteobacteria bacterium]